MFKEVPVPVTDTEKRRVISSQKVMINDVEYPTGYNIILRSGETLNGQRFGEVIDIHGKPV
jgi:hypothetical protein